jgi:hypothetical protein
MKTVEEIAGMVTIRNHLQSLRDRSLIRRSDYQPVNSLIQQLDQDIINSSMELFRQQSQVQVEEELNISKKIAEAKAKLHQRQAEPVAKKSSPQDKKAAPVEDDAKFLTRVEKPRPSFKKKPAVLKAPPAEEEDKMMVGVEVKDDE